MVGKNLHFEVRYAGSDVEKMRAAAKELVRLAPDVFLTWTAPASAAVLRETQTIPTVFVYVSDPVGLGFVKSIPHPGGNVTGFLAFEGSLIGKWVELLKEVAPSIRRTGFMFNPPADPQAEYFMEPFKRTVHALGVEPSINPVQDDEDVERAIQQLSRAHGGLVIVPDAFTYTHRFVISRLAVRDRVPQSARSGLSRAMADWQVMASTTKMSFGGRRRM